MVILTPAAWSIFLCFMYLLRLVFSVSSILQRHQSGMTVVKSEPSGCSPQADWRSLSGAKQTASWFGYHTIGGFFSAVIKLRGNSSYWKCHGIRFPPRARSRNRAGHRSGSTGRVRHAAIRRMGVWQGSMEREKPFSQDMSNPGRHSEGHFGGELEDRLPWETKTGTLNGNRWEILQITSETSQPRVLGRHPTPRRRTLWRTPHMGSRTQSLKENHRSDALYPIQWFSLNSQWGESLFFCMTDEKNSCILKS